MSKQVVTIGPDGSISGLQVKPGKGVDLRQFGNASIRRASDIVWMEEDQRWMIKILVGQHRGRFVTNLLWFYEAGQHEVPETSEIGWADTLYFRDYDDAVEAEKEFFNAIQTAKGSAAFA